MKREEAEKYLLKLEQYSSSMTNHLRVFIAQRRPGIEIDFDDPDIYDGFHEVFLLINEFHKKSGFKLNFLTDFETIDKSNKRLLEIKDKNELYIIYLEDLLQKNNIQY